MSSEPSSSSNPHARADAHALAPGTQIRDYTIGEVIGTGGFSIVYKAMDNSLDRDVAIKEYFPTSFAVRTPDGAVQPLTRDSATFSKGIESFLNEGKLLAAFDHPALVRVYRCWEERGTAYLAMRLYAGTTLRDAVKAGEWRTDELSLVALLQPICNALDVLHAARCYHRDVAPDNIMLVDTGGRLAPVLLDFGAARKAIESTQVFTAILKPGYAPIEQYGDGDLKQGPWTDIYALAGVVYFTLSGNAPPTAINRMLRDAMVRPRDAFVGRLPERWLDAIETALAVKPEARPQTISEFVALFGWDEITEGTVVIARRVAADSRPLAVEMLQPVPTHAPAVVTSVKPPIDPEQTVVAPLPPTVSRSVAATPSASTPVAISGPATPPSMVAARQANVTRTAVWLGGATALVAAAGLAWKFSAVPAQHSPVIAPPPITAQPPNATPTSTYDTIPDKKTSIPVTALPKSEPLSAPTSTVAADTQNRKSVVKPPRAVAPADSNAEGAGGRGTKKSAQRERPARCELLIERFQLGESPSAADQRFFQESCK